MNTAPFYELRARLYSCAAAGCSSVGEDFRLKRALEEFDPLSKANKAFGRLSEMCGRLFTEKDPAPLLADCIALADALAVTQGTFSESGEALPLKERFSGTPAQIPYSRIEFLRDTISKGAAILNKLYPKDSDALSDPRIVSLFLDGAGNGRGDFDLFAEIMIKLHGKKLSENISLRLSESLNDPDADGTEIKYLGIIAMGGSDEEKNIFLDRCTEIAMNTDDPPKVRIQAISAMGQSVGCASDLAELYKTEKGKIKNAALAALSKLECPESNEIFGKLTAKPTKAALEYIGMSKCSVCEEYVKSNFYKELELLKTSGRTAMNFTQSVIPLFANKSGLYDCYAAVSDNAAVFGKLTNISYIISELNNMLIQNLKNSGRQPYEELIERLYAHNKNVFFPSMFFLDLTRMGGNALDKYKDMVSSHRESINSILAGIYFVPVINKYCLAWNYSMNDKKPLLELSDIYPGQVQDFFINAEDNNYTMGGVPERVSGSNRNYGTAAYESVRYSAGIMNTLLSSCSPRDHDRLKSNAVDFALKYAKKYPSSGLIDILAAHCGKDRAAECKGIASAYILYLINERHAAADTGSIIDKLPLSEQDKIDEMNTLKKELENLKKKRPELSAAADIDLRYIKEYLGK